MNANLRDQFDRAVGDDPGADVGAMAAAAVVAGGRIRRRRRLTAVAGAATVVVMGLGVVAGVNFQTREPAEPAVTVPMGFSLAQDCNYRSEEKRATDVAIFGKTGITGRDRAAIRDALGADGRVKEMVYESNQEAYERFVGLWKDSPEFVKSVTPESLPESFRVRLKDAREFRSFRAEYAKMAGVQDIIGNVCPPSAPVGGIK
ncbi:permease-like cell division protein FtsX [Actinoplanes bogorensis]|uniref:Permease-like cell division protein FtsX n=1 Tax=Paractinoplanes bogorensis TaxID=1610840 RepID=A0ABS5YRT6_9ACTN|nr:permease-like cell division protein FtsX [Actinoplanes bogorensis]MBU2666160.1 permease-like cell division protein FtsX [Actinoplanes bogorensis]